ncbi:MAG TPA: cupredoxin domain-containing protein [Solirubrobacterales bacterium]|nr:cupredoxin domain-containing protein [Solirubrobacterales bacterium]
MKKLMILLVLALAAIALVACGDDEGTTTTDSGAESTGAAAGEAEEEAGAGEEGKAAGGGSSVEIEAGADTGLAYTSDEASAEAGEVTIEFTNAQSLSHDVAIEDSSGEQIGKTEVIADGEDSTTVELEAGEYTFYCTVPGHREAGMEGTLPVE